MLASLMASSITFKKCTVEKLAFIALNLIDLILTLFAVSHGAHELNPLMRNMLNAPFQLYVAKLVLPVFFAWLLPGKLLIPSIALLTFVVGWDIRELMIFFF
jgi:hypothetical protein